MNAAVKVESLSRPKVFQTIPVLIWLNYEWGVNIEEQEPGLE